MRALIRVKLEPTQYFINLWKNRKNWDEEIVKILTTIGYPPKVTGQKALSKDKRVLEIIKDMPKDIAAEERQHLVMFGYTSDGQAGFVVTGVNPNEIHVRIKGRVFSRVRRASREFLLKIHPHRKRRFQKALFSLEPKGYIEVLEGGSDSPTILGRVITRPARYLLQKHQAELVTLLVTSFVSTLLFFFTPSIKTPVSQFFQSLGFDFTEQYIGGAFERLYSAFLVTSVTIALTQFLRYLELKRLFPVDWGTDIESMHGL